MTRNAAGFNLIDLAVLVAIIAVLWLVVPMAQQKFKVLAANNACMSEAEAYAASALRAIVTNQVPAPPVNHACTETTDASRGATVDADITARARAPGTARITCDLNTRAACTSA